MSRPCACSCARPPPATSRARRSAWTAMSNTSDPALKQASADSAAKTLIDRNFARLMPLLVAGYILNFLDRTNIALAKTALQHDVGISPAAYGLGAGLFFLV